MKTRLLIAALAAAALMPTASFAQSSTVGGAVGGAAVGGVVGGPVGAAVGAAVGGTVGAAVEPPPPGVVTYVQKEEVPSVTVEKHVVVGEPIPSTVELHAVPKYSKYRYAMVNGHKVIVEYKTHRVVQVID